MHSRTYTDEQNDFAAAGWVDRAAALPVAFAQVREDSNVDETLVNSLAPDCSGIMIASGGCTAAHLGARGRFRALHLVDVNDAQLTLTKLKLALVEMAPEEERLMLLGHSYMDPDGRKRRLEQILAIHDARLDDLGSPDFVARRGPNNIGRYEILFQKLADELKAQSCVSELLLLNNVDKQKAYIAANPNLTSDLRDAFRKVMDLTNLIKLFGQQATQNAVVPFWQHFFERTSWALESFPAADNPYLMQVLSGRFGTAAHPWFSLQQNKMRTQFTFHRKSMKDALSQTSERFDFIHLSNILDWLNTHEAAELLQESAKKLTPDGIVIIRQLNSGLQLSELCAELAWDLKLGSQLQVNDRSYFYPRIWVARGR